MKLIKLIAAINYNEMPKGMDYRRKIMSLLLNKEVSESQMPPVIEALQMRIEDQKLYIVVSQDKTGVEVNQPKGIDEARSIIFALFEKLNTVTQWGNINRIGVRSHWIKPYNGNLNDLIQVYKNKLYKNNQLVEESKDVALVLTLENNNNKINFNSGPMEKEQLSKMFLPPAPFNENELPDVVSFVDTDYFVLENVPFSTSNINQYMIKALDFSRIQAKKMFQILDI